MLGHMLTHNISVCVTLFTVAAPFYIPTHPGIPWHFQVFKIVNTCSGIPFLCVFYFSMEVHLLMRWWFLLSANLCIRE